MWRIWPGMLFVIAGLTLISCQSQKQAEVALEPSDTAMMEGVYQEGRAAYEAGRYNEAAEKFARIVQVDPTHVKALINWGVSLSRSGQPLQAIPNFQQALGHDPNNAETPRMTAR